MRSVVISVLGKLDDKEILDESNKRFSKYLKNKNSLDANGNFSEALAKSDKQIKGQLAVTGKWERRSDQPAIRFAKEIGDRDLKKRGWESTNLSFYENHYVRGATRFAKEIIPFGPIINSIEVSISGRHVCIISLFSTSSFKL